MYSQFRFDVDTMIQQMDNEILQQPIDCRCLMVSVLAFRKKTLGRKKLSKLQHSDAFYGHLNWILWRRGRKRIEKL